MRDWANSRLRTPQNYRPRGLNHATPLAANCSASSLRDAGVACAARSARHAGAAFSWQHDLEAAKTLAKQTNRLVLVHFWTPSCAPCLTLDQTVFNQAGVAAAIEARFVPVKLNANENSATAQGFGITRVPTDVILTPDGHVVGKLISPPTPAGYVAELNQVAAAYTSTPARRLQMRRRARRRRRNSTRLMRTCRLRPTLPPAVSAVREYASGSCATRNARLAIRSAQPEW